MSPKTWPFQWISVWLPLGICGLVSRPGMIIKDGNDDKVCYCAELGMHSPIFFKVIVHVCFLCTKWAMPHTLTHAHTHTYRHTNRERGREKQRSVELSSSCPGVMSKEAKKLKQKEKFYRVLIDQIKTLP